MKINYNIIDFLIKKTECSNIFYRHSSAIIYNNKILSYGINKVKNGMSIHAEMDAILNSKFDVQGLDMIVIRYSNNIKNSRPCNHCIKNMKKKGIRKVYYSNEKEEIIYEYVEEMKEQHDSAVYKNCNGRLKFV
jgi:cytidine deaminase